MPVQPWFLLAIGASFAGYAIYLAGLNRRLVEPNRASWLIWGSATLVEAITYAAVNPGTLQSWVFLLSAAACLTIAASLWRRSRWAAPDAIEATCMAAALAAIALWLIFRETFWAHMLMVAMVPVSFWPTWRSVWADRARERSPAWGLWSVGDLATLILATQTDGVHQAHGVGEFAYILVELACHASVWFMIGLATINPWRSFGWSDGRLRVLDAYAPAVNPFRVGETHLGKAVFAVRGFAPGEEIITFTGKRLSARRVPRRLARGGDRYVQVGRDAYLGPSGAIDDLINHSCDPNAGLHFTDTGPILTAIRAITAGEEIAWDYSTTLSDSHWTMRCGCGAAACRGTVAAFATLPLERREWFLARNLVAPYLRDDMCKAGQAA